MLTMANSGRYDYLALEKDSAGIGVPYFTGGRTATSAVFFRPLHGSPLWAAAQGSFGNAVSCDAVRQPVYVAHPIGVGLAMETKPSQETIMSNITILSTEIRQHGELYSLNDLHKASGGAQKHRPKYFLSNQQTKDLIAEISIGGIPPIQAKQGLGTYACRELVIAYAAWISAAFHLKVIRVFLDSQKQEVQPSQADLMKQLQNCSLLISFDDDGKMKVMPFSDNEFVAKREKMPDYIRRTGYDAPFSFPLVVEMAHAMVDRMAAEANRWKGNYDGAIKRLKEATQ